jgi:hypothetical protein
MWRENSNLDQVQRIFRCGSEKILCSAENVREQMARPLSPVTHIRRSSLFQNFPVMPQHLPGSPHGFVASLGRPSEFGTDSIERLGTVVHVEEARLGRVPQRRVA